MNGSDSCRLLLINLYSYVENKFTNKSIFDFEKFKKHAEIAQKLMDDLVDIEIEKIDAILTKISKDPESEEEKYVEKRLWEKIKDNCIKGRRTGLGITALGDTIAALGVKYGTEESIELTEEIYKALCLSAYRSTVNLAKERGCFPIFDLEIEQDHPFISQVMNEDEELKKDYIKYGRRNIALTTTAPAGSVSTETQTTSGIEPAFLLSYKRRRKVDKDTTEKVDFIDASGDCWVEYDVFHKPFLEWKQITGLENIEDSPYAGCLANDIDWKMSVKQQSVAQKWICHSISRTVNLPSTATEQDVNDIYWEGWKSGCKGLTIYRDGSRSGVLLDKKEEQRKENFSLNNAPKRPKELECDIHRATIQGEKWVVLVGMLEGKPYEVFVGLSDKIELPKKFINGRIIKHAKKTMQSTYDLIIGKDDDQMTIKDVIGVFDNPNNASITRLISLSLRHGSGVRFVVEQLLKDQSEDFTSFSKVVARTLKKYIVDGEKASDKVCPSCSAEGTLFYSEGCVSCKSCSFSKCN